MEIPTLIYCSGGNRRFAEIAINAGFKYGSQMPETIYFDPYFIDQNWKKPNRAVYMAALEKYKPHLATVLDWERPEQLPEVLSWAEETAQYVGEVLIIPKVHGGIKQLPRSIGGKPVRLGFSVPTRFGGTDLFTSEFAGWPVHLLGGSPKKQKLYARYLNIVSADGNYAQKMATRFCEYWNGRKWCELSDNNGHIAVDAPYAAFELSCKYIIEMWWGQNPAGA